MSSNLPAARVTNIRHLVIAVTVLISLILYLDRYCVSFAEIYIQEDLGLSARQIFWFTSAFFWSYALGQVPSGWLSDFLGSRGVLVLYIILWSLFTALIGLSNGFVMLIVMRLGCGLGQAGAYPTAGTILSRWAPKRSRGTASSLVALGGRLGAVSAPILTAYLMVSFVPLSTPATWDGSGILDGRALCQQLWENSNASKSAVTSPMAKVYLKLTDAAQRIVDRYGSESAKTEKEHRRSLPSVPASDLTVLATGLNGLLDQPDLFTADDFKHLKKAEREVIDLQKRRAHGEKLSALEAVRFNRLYLEGLFPRELGKLYVKGWRPVQIVYGAAGVFVALLFWFVFRNSPSEHPWCSPGERDLIAEGSSPSSAAKGETPPFPRREILESFSLWMSSLSQFGTNVAWLFFVTTLPRYLSEVHAVPILERSMLTAIPPLGGIAGMFLGGRITDYLSPRIGLRWGRALPIGVTRFGAALAYLSCLWIHDPWIITVVFAGAFFFVDLGVAATWAFCQDVGGKHVASILGWGNMWGNFGAAVAPQLYVAILRDQPGTGDWNNLFLFCAAMFVVSGAAGLGIDATKPIVLDKRTDLS